MNRQKIKLKKSLGQNFLKDPKILQKIVDFAKIEKGDLVLEVGPGEGTLTKLLLAKAKKVIAIEKDEELAELLQEKFAGEIKEGKLKIICGDVLKIENLLKIAKLKIENYILVGNIPYYITGALFKKFLELENQPKSITFVAQKEVAERITAKDNKESILSISVKVYGTPEFGGIIKAGSFNPKPKVDSAIIAVRDISKEKFVTTEQKFFEILRAGFAHKRKLLIKNLGAENIIFKKCGLTEKARAEDLKIEDWLCLTKELS